MLRKFQVICSTTAAAALSDEERTGIVQAAIPMAIERDRGVHEGLAFSFDLRGQEWQIIVDLGEAWVKIMTKDEYRRAVEEAVGKN
jgi:hypothetical protein